MSRPPRYDAVAMILHWTMAIGIAALVILGLLMVHGGLPMMRQFAMYQLHKSIGVTVLLAAVLRLLWRLTHRPPALPPMPAAERAAASGTHWALYALMLGLPLSGWALVSASPLNLPTVLYGVVPCPHLPVFSTLADKKTAEAVLQWVHAWLAWGLLAFLFLHIGGALRHAFHGESVLGRMLPLPQRRVS